MNAPADLSAAQPPTQIVVSMPVTLGQFVKLAGFAATGGEAKRLVTSGLVTLNGEIEVRRGHRLNPGDMVEVQGQKAQVVTSPRQTSGGSRCSSGG